MLDAVLNTFGCIFDEISKHAIVLFKPSFMNTRLDFLDVRWDVLDSYWGEHAMQIVLVLLVVNEEFMSPWLHKARIYENFGRGQFFGIRRRNGADRLTLLVI